MVTSEEEGERNQQYFHRQKLPWLRTFLQERGIQTSSEGKCKRKAGLVELALNAHSYTNKGILTVEVLFEKYLRKEMLVKLDKFYSKHMFPDILTRHIKNLQAEILIINSLSVVLKSPKQNYFSVHFSSGGSRLQMAAQTITSWLATQIDISFLCVCPIIDHEFRHHIVKVAVDPLGDSRVDPQTTLTML